MQPPWDGGKKIWADSIYTYERGASQWKLAGHLPTPLGYGARSRLSTACCSWEGRLRRARRRSTLRLTLHDGRVEIQQTALLARAMSMFAAALLHDRVYRGRWARPALFCPRFAQISSRFPCRSPHLFRRTASNLARPPAHLSARGGARWTISTWSAERISPESPGPPVGRRFLTDAFRYRARPRLGETATSSKSSAGGLSLFVERTPTDFRRERWLVCRPRIRVDGIASGLSAKKCWHSNSTTPNGPRSGPCHIRLSLRVSRHGEMNG